jgi:hypothetical protein
VMQSFQLGNNVDMLIWPGHHMETTQHTLAMMPSSCLLQDPVHGGSSGRVGY